MAEEKQEKPRRPAPEIHPVFVFPTPDKRDLLFYTEHDARLPKNAPGTWEYGDLFWDKVKYPNHKLVWVTPQTEDNWERRWYAADRADQDAYNYTVDGDQVVRFYVVRRDLYYQRTAAEAAAAVPVVPGEFTVPAVATPDVRFSDYGFADDTVVELPEEIRSRYIGIQRRYLVPTHTDVLYDPALQRNVNVVRQLIDKDAATGTSTPGNQIERDDGNNFHDWRITSTVVLGEGESYPLEMTSYIADIPYRFPQLLRGARMVAAWALADSAEAARSYDEAWYIKWDLVDPAVGPYEAQVLRFLTDDPDELRAEYPVQKFITVRETIGISRAWFHASNKGNSTYAEARQIEVPPSVHGDITITNGASLSAGQSTNFLPATPRFAEVSGLSSMVVGYESKQVQYGLFVVEITIINCTGVYNGATVPMGTTNSPGSLPPDMGASVPPEESERPDTPSGTVSADNTTISGFTSPSAEVRASIAGSQVGQGVANTDGSYTITLVGSYSDAVSVSLVAWLDGLASVEATVSTNDLSPGRPSGYINAAMTSVTGKTEPGATISILRNAAAQVETATIPDLRPQVETLTVIDTVTGDGDAEIVITWAGFNGGVAYPVTFAVLNGDTPEVVATKAAAALTGNATVAAFFTATQDGDDIILAAIAVAADDPAADFTLDNDTSTGLTLQTSVDTTPGSDPVLITVAGTAKATVTSGLATFAPVLFYVEVGDDPTDVATKAAAALNLSVVSNYYNAGSSTNTVTLTADDIAANDPALMLVIENDSCEGLISSGESANTTPGGSVVTVVATSAGDYTYTFGPALSSGDLINITASDAGGTSEALVLEANATPPTLATAIFADSDTITGTGTVGAKIIAYDGDTDIGDTVVGGGGTFSLDTDYKLIRGETAQVVAVTVGNEDVRSAPIFIVAADLNLEAPSFTRTSAGYVGTTPSGATEIRIRKVLDSSETTATLHTNGTFSFTLPDNPPGTAFDVYARYATGDSDPVRIFFPYIPVREPFLSLSLGTVPAGFSGDPPLGYVQDTPYFYAMRVGIFDWVSGIDMTISFPGTDEPDITVSGVPEDEADYTPYDYGNPNGTINPAAGTQDYLRYTKAIPLDESGPVPMPFPVVVATFTYPDGQQSSVTFDRATFKNDSFKDGVWNFAKFLPEYRRQEWEDYYL